MQVGTGGIHVDVHVVFMVSVDKTAEPVGVAGPVTLGDPSHRVV